MARNVIRRQLMQVLEEGGSGKIDPLYALADAQFKVQHKAVLSHRLVELMCSWPKASGSHVYPVPAPWRVPPFGPGDNRKDVTQALIDAETAYGYRWGGDWQQPYLALTRQLCRFMHQQLKNGACPQIT